MQTDAPLPPTAARKFVLAQRVFHERLAARDKAFALEQEALDELNKLSVQLGFANGGEKLRFCDGYAAAEADRAAELATLRSELTGALQQEKTLTVAWEGSERENAKLRARVQELEAINPFAAFIEALRNDREMQWGYHCNVACAVRDEGLTHDVANRAAVNFMTFLLGKYEPLHYTITDAQPPTHPTLVRRAFDAVEIGKCWEAFGQLGIVDIPDSAMRAAINTALDLLHVPEPKVYGWAVIHNGRHYTTYSKAEGYTESAVKDKVSDINELRTLYDGGPVQ